MAHHCPECGEVCGCHGDIDDLLIAASIAEDFDCKHCDLDYDDAGDNDDVDDVDVEGWDE